VTRSLKQFINSPYNDLLSAATSGLIAALVVTSQIEHLITASHVHNVPVRDTFTKIYSKDPMKIFLPPGMVAMVGREVPFATALFYLRPLIATKFGSSLLLISRLLTVLEQDLLNKSP
jgi:hypothetical protein